MKLDLENILKKENIPILVIIAIVALIVIFATISFIMPKQKIGEQNVTPNVTPTATPSETSAEQTPPSATQTPQMTNKASITNNNVVYSDDFSKGYNDYWILESKTNGEFYISPIVQSDGLQFTVQGGALPGSVNGLSKIYFQQRNKLSYGTYTTKFKINRVPTDNTDEQIYFGMGLWEFGNGGFANEVMMGFYLIYNNQAQRWDDRLQVLSRENGGHSKVSSQDIRASDFVNTFHTIKFVYTPDKITGYLDGEVVLKKTDYIPSTPMSFILGTRIASGTPLSEDLYVTYDYISIDAQLAGQASGSGADSSSGE